MVMGHKLGKLRLHSSLTLLRTIVAYILCAVFFSKCIKLALYSKCESSNPIHKPENSESGSTNASSNFSDSCYCTFTFDPSANETIFRRPTELKPTRRLFGKTFTNHVYSMNLKDF